LENKDENQVKVNEEDKQAEEFALLVEEIDKLMTQGLDGALETPISDKLIC
jgi:hypothetical protein